MKKLLILTAVFLIALTTYMGFNRGWFKGNAGDRRDFAITDTAGLSKIFMANKHGKRLLLEKTNGVWMVNGKYEANKSWLKQLMETMMKVQVKTPVPKNALNGVVKNLSNDHIKVEIYTNNELQKTYFVGGSTQDMTGTYMWIENSACPYICEIPGFEGFLQPRFNLDEMVWRSRKIFAIAPESIEEITVTYNDPQKSGFIINQAHGKVSLKSLNKQPVLNFDSLMVKYYIELFKEVHAEAFGMVFKIENSDSIRRSVPWCRIEVKTPSGTESLNLHLRKVNERTKQQFDLMGEDLEFDTERYYGYKNDDPLAMLIQDYVFGPFLRSAADFEKKKLIDKAIN